MSVKIALLGFGTVAKGLPYLLTENNDKIYRLSGTDISISTILVKQESDIKELVTEGYNYNFTTSIDDILEDSSIDIVIELMGRIEPAKTYISQALARGKHVVTANKDLIALHGVELIELAKKNKVSFYYEASVAGGIPILRTLSQSFISDKITRLTGILNGTSNFMMTKMVECGWTYEKALKTAQELGYAESNPKNDVEGIDAAYKVAILSQFAFGQYVPFDQIHHQGINVITPEDVALAKKMGYVIKLLGDIRSTNSGIYAEVVPTFIEVSHPLASVNDVMNAIYVESIGIGQSMFYGPGAGQKPTATSVMADIMHISSIIKNNLYSRPFTQIYQSTQLSKPEHLFSPYYFAVKTNDKTGQLSHLAQLFSQFGISFKQVIQDKSKNETALIAVIIHSISQKQLKEVVSALSVSKEFTLANYFKVLGDSNENKSTGNLS